MHWKASRYPSRFANGKKGHLLPQNPETVETRKPEEENPHTYAENPVSTPGNNRETQETVSGENGGRDASLTSEEAELFEHFLAKTLSENWHSW